MVESSFYKFFDGRCTSTILCSRSRCGAREAMTVGCKPTINFEHFRVLRSFFAWGPQALFRSEGNVERSRAARQKLFG